MAFVYDTECTECNPQHDAGGLINTKNMFHWHYRVSQGGRNGAELFLTWFQITRQHVYKKETRLVEQQEAGLSVTQCMQECRAVEPLCKLLCRPLFDKMFHNFCYLTENVYSGKFGHPQKLGSAVWCFIPSYWTTNNLFVAFRVFRRAAADI